MNGFLNNAKGIFKVENEMGIDPRFALKIVHLSKKYPDTDIAIVGKKKVADAKSIIGIMTLAATKGARLIITVNGPDAQTAIKELSHLFKQDFGNNFLTDPLRN